MTEITWLVSSLERRTSDGYVTTAHWRANAVDGEFTATSYGSCGWGDGTPEVPYEDLTPEMVLEWCWDAGGVDKAAVEESLESQIEAQKNPVTASGTPW